jgi:DNA-binding transcriptional LysR family regulator
MEIRQLRYFLAVAESLNFTAAAKKLGIAQPPLSTQIKQLEKQIGQTLFYRSSRKVELTDAGRLLSLEAACMLEQADLLSAKMADLRDGRSACVTVGIARDLATMQIARMFRKFTRKHRGVRCDIQFFDSNLCEIQDRMDILVVDRAEMPEWPALDLGMAPLYLAICRKHRLADRESIQTCDLSGEHLLQSPPGFQTRAERLILAGDPQLPSRLSTEWVKGGVDERVWRAEAGLGVAIVTEEDTARSGITAVKFSEEAGMIRPILAYREENHHTGVTAMIAHFKECLTR